MVSDSPNPHQLDFDWRFTDSSIFAISERIGRCENLLLIGCPSLMETSYSKISAGLLFERNPNRAPVEKFRVIRDDIRFYEARSHYSGLFDTAVVDAPWYPNEFLCWIKLALAYTKRGGSILFVLWPETTRPTSKEEHHFIFSVLNKIGDIKALGTVSYDAPPFELASLRGAEHSPNYSREGLIFSLIKRTDSFTAVTSFKKSEAVWRRYELFSQQLAIKLNPSELGRPKSPDFVIEPFVLANTSRRNPELQKINIWTSDNIAGKLRNPYFVDRQIQKLRMGSCNEFGFQLLEELGLISERKQIDWVRTWLHRA